MPTRREFMHNALTVPATAGLLENILHADPHEKAQKNHSIHILDEAYGKLPIPDAFKSHEEFPELPTSSRPPQKIDPIKAEAPEEIEQILQKEHPEVITALKYALNDGGTVDRDEALQAIAEFTRKLAGRELHERHITNLHYRDPLAEIVASNMRLYYSPETLRTALDTGLASIIGKDRPAVVDITRFPIDFAYFASKTTNSMEATKEQYKNAELVKTLSQHYQDTEQDKVPASQIPVQSLASIYNWLPEQSKIQDFRKALASLVPLYKKAYDADGLAIEDAVKLVRKLIPRGRTAAPQKALDQSIARVVEYIGHLVKQKEKQIGLALNEFEHYSGHQLTTERFNLLQELHAQYGITKIGRIKDDKGDPERFGNMLLENSNRRVRSDKPVALLALYRSRDLLFDTASLGNMQKVFTQLAQGYKVLMYEIGSQQGLVDAFQKAEDATGKKAAVVIIGGHGSQFDVNLGANIFEMHLPKKQRLRGNGAIHYGNSRADQFLDIADGETIQTLGKYITPDATVILYSCLTGKGGSREVNMANTTAFNLPGRLVAAPTESTRGLDLKVSNEGSFEKLEFLNGRGVKVDTYRVMREQ